MSFYIRIMKPKFTPLSNKRIAEMEEQGLIGLTEGHTDVFATTGRIDYRLQLTTDSEGPSVEGVNAGEYSFLRDIASDRELGYRAERTS